MPDYIDTPFEDPSREPSFRWDGLKDEEHLMQCFPTDASAVESVGLFMEDALKQGAAGIVVARAEYLTKIEQFLGTKGLNADDLQRAGRYIPLDGRELLESISKDGRVDSQRFFERVGRLVSNASNSWGRVRVFGEMVGFLWEEGRREEALELEGLWNQLAKIYPFVLFCGYPKDAHDDQAETFRHVCEAHSIVIR